MRLNHLDCHVPDVAAACDFFVTFLGFRETAPDRTAPLAILHDEAGFELVLSQPFEKFGSRHQADGGAVTYHLGFILPERAAVDALYEQLHAAGHAAQPPRALRGGWLFYCRAPGAILIEIGWRAA